jgi:hypothetical protein
VVVVLQLVTVRYAGEMPPSECDMQHVLYRRGGARAWTEVVGPNHVFVAGEAGSNAGVTIWCSGAKLGAMRCDATFDVCEAIGMECDTWSGSAGIW